MNDWETVYTHFISSKPHPFYHSPLAPNHSDRVIEDWRGKEPASKAIHLQFVIATTQYSTLIYCAES